MNMIMMIMMMNKKIQQKWIKALRSNKYKQIKNNMRDKDGFCVIGLLLDIIRDKYSLFWNFNDCTNTYRLCYKQYLFDHVDFLLILKNINLDIDIVNKIMILNDKKNYNFRQLANYIERYV